MEDKFIIFLIRTENKFNDKAISAVTAGYIIGREFQKLVDATLLTETHKNFNIETCRKSKNTVLDKLEHLSANL